MRASSGPPPIRLLCGLIDAARSTRYAYGTDGGCRRREELQVVGLEVAYEDGLADTERRYIDRNLVGQFVNHAAYDELAGREHEFAADLYSPEQITAYNALLQRAAEIPLFLGIDEEGGTVARLANHSAFDLPQYKSAGAVGASGNPEDALEMGQTIGAYLGEYGFNMDFAPVADVNTNPNNPVIGNRSFSSDCNVAGQMAKAMAEGLEEQGIVPVFKHFPGHGDTAQDSHEEVAYSHKTLEELQACEFVPFSGLTENQCVMVGHIALPEVTGDMTPATLSSEIVTGLLREKLGFRGLILTDSMVMEAITDNYSSAEASLLALEAGCQIILQPADFPSAFDGVQKAVEAGTFPEEQLNAVVLQILRFKQETCGNLS